MPTSAARIHRSRTFAKLTQVALADKVGVQRSAVGQWEQVVGTRPSAANLCRVAEITHVRFEWLATGRRPMKIGDTQQATAIVVSDFAYDDLESRLLHAIRRMSSLRKRQAIVEMIEELTR